MALTERDRQRAIRRRWHQIPAIAVTAYRDRREEFLAEGFAELVEKPINLMALCEVVRRHAG